MRKTPSKRSLKREPTITWDTKMYLASDPVPTVSQGDFLIRGGGTWTRMIYLQEWQEAYPGVNIRAELQRAALWLRANPAKRKTARGMPRFLVNWMSRAARDVKPQPQKLGRRGLAASGIRTVY